MPTGKKRLECAGPSDSESDSSMTPDRAQNESSEESAPAGPKAKPSIKIIAAIIAAAMLLISGGSYWYINYQIPHRNAVASFNDAADALASRNAELEAAITDLQALRDSGDTPLDAATDEAAGAAIEQAQDAEQSAPSMPDRTEEINATAQSISAMGNYTEQFASLTSAKQTLQNRISQLKQVTDPGESFVIHRLTGLPNITGVEAATEDNDPNGQLGKSGSYTAAVYFTSDLVDVSKTYASPGYTGIVATGTDGGGCVEVYKTSEDAQKRDQYLAAFDGGILSS